jgi:NAD(P)H-dependent FMN reductase
MPTPKILAFGGALRRGSFNNKVAAIAAQGAQEAGAEVTFIALRDYPLPVFDGDLEDAEGLPENAKKLKALFRGHDGWIISTPEYNSSIPGALKNVIDWVSREETDDEPPLSAFTGKTAILCSASPGALGAIRSLAVVRSILANIGVTMLPEKVSVSRAHEAFHEDGSLKDEKQAARVKALGATLTKHLVKMLA